MAILVDLTDTEGQTWDIRDTNGGGLSIVDGTNDAFDFGMILFVNGTPVNPLAASVDFNGREVNAVPVLIGGIAVQRQVLVSDAAISSIGFARFFDSFTNTTDAAITITVQTRSDSGADANTTLTTSSGDGILTTADKGFFTEDGAAAADSIAMIAYGDGQSTSLAPSSATLTDNDDIAITHTLTLQPGETQSLLQFVTQTDAGDTVSAGLDLTNFTNSAIILDASGFLAGLTREEQLSIVNYSGFDALHPAHTITDSDGNRWGIDDLGRLSTLDSGAVQNFTIPVLAQNFDELLSVTTNAVTGEVTVVTGGFVGSPGTTVTYTYTPLQGQGVIRLVVTIEGGSVGFLADLDPAVITGYDPALLPAQAASPDFSVASGVVLDDSESGTGGTLPALTYVFGATGADNTTSVSGTNITTNMPGQGAGPGGTAQFLFFFALNDTGLGGLADLTRLNTPGPQELTGLSAEVVSNLRNFGIDEFGGRLQEVLGADGVDDVITGHHWGDSIVSGSGDDVISALGSDDIVRGGIGEDQIDGGDGADSLFGGSEDDVITGGADNDLLDGAEDNDNLLGQSGDDDLFGGVGFDTLIGGSGADSLVGDLDSDTLRGNTGNDTLFGGEGFDDLSGGANDDLLFGGDGIDQLIGGSGNDTLNGDADLDFLSGGDGLDAINGGTGEDALSGNAGNDTLNGDDDNDFLYGGDNVDSLLGGNNDDQLFGGASADRLFGGSGADSLTGGMASDTGANRLFGGQDGDTYFVNSANDIVNEAPADTGIDTVFSSISYTLVNNVENLVLQDTGLLSGFGNNQANQITGNSSANFIDGGLGRDTMIGGLGDDVFIIRDSTDVVQELNGTLGGRDTARSFVTHTLADNVENLILLGTNPVNGTGNGAINKLIGNDFANVLNGGLGNDILTGGLGTDVFLFNTALDATANVDRIVDFSGAGERIRLSDDVFTTLAPGNLSNNFFVNGSAALDANDRILYDAATGTLRYDADGVGTFFQSIVFAVLDNNFALSNTDFQIIA